MDDSSISGFDNYSFNFLKNQTKPLVKLAKAAENSVKETMSMILKLPDLKKLEKLHLNLTVWQKELTDT